MRWEWNDAAVAALGRQAAQDVGQRVEEAAHALAPKRTGAGSASIHTAQMGDSVAIGWDAAHHYLRFQDYVSSRHGTTTHFLEHALDSYARG